MTITKHRESRYLTKKQMKDLIDAAAYAELAGIPFTRMLHFNLNSLETRAQDFLSAFFKLAGDWLRTKNIARAYAWIIEHPPTASLNVHCLIHVPPVLMGAFVKKQRRWMREAGYVWKKGRLVSERICDRRNKSKGPRTVGERMANTEGGLGYAMKGGAPAACQALRIECDWQGYVRGKGCGVAESIGNAARAADNYRAPIGCNSLLFRWRHRL